MTVADVESVLGGAWNRTDQGAGKCVYHSDRGAIFAVQPIPTPRGELEAALHDARVNSCDTAPRDVADTGGAFVCIQRSNREDLVEGNIIAQSHLWVTVMIGAGPDPHYPAQAEAMLALLRAVRR